MSQTNLHMIQLETDGRSEGLGYKTHSGETRAKKNHASRCESVVLNNFYLEENLLNREWLTHVPLGRPTSEVITPKTIGVLT